MDHKRIRITFTAFIAVALTLGGCGGASSPSAPVIAWEQIDPDPSSADGPIEFVAWKDGYVGISGGLAWTSDDGLAWSGGPVLADEPVSVRSLAVLDGRLVAVGAETAGGESPSAVVLVSSDGETWRRTPDDPDLGPGAGYGSTELDEVALGPGGLVAAGTEWGDAGQHPAAWWSADGLDWVRAAAPAGGSGARDLAPYGDGFVLAVAGDAGPGEMTHAAFWVTDDGRSWTAAPDAPSYANAEPQSLAVRDGMIVAVGYRVTAAGQFAPMTWSSTDGVAWEPADDTPAMAWWPFPGPTPVTDQGGLRGTMMASVGADRDGFLAVGTSFGLDPSKPKPDGTYARSFRGNVWRSSDGRSWELLPEHLVEVSAQTSTMHYGLIALGDLDGRPLVVGATDAGITFWLGPASLD